LLFELEVVEAEGVEAKRGGHDCWMRLGPGVVRAR
jgi:hypothetical protein